MARLAEQLINEGESVKAKEIIDLAIEKMPIDKFGYYSLIVPFIDNYYRISEIKLAQSLATKISKKYSGRLNYFSSLKTGFQYEMGEEIVTEIERYRTLMEAILVNKDKVILESEIDRFIESTKPFIFLYGEYDYYTSLLDMVDGYYLIDSNKKAEKIGNKILDVYKKRLNVFINLSPENKVQYAEQIKNEILDFKYFVEIISSNEKGEFSDKIEKEYNLIIDEFKK